MAGERKGEAFEALTYLALTELGYELGKNLFWGEAPKGFSMKPDFVLGSLENPTHWMMLTSTQSAKNTPEKFWRSIGELFETKQRFSPAPAVINLVGEAKQMDNLQHALTRLTDGEILVSEKDYGRILIDFIENEKENLPQNRQAKTKHLNQLISKDKDIGHAFSQYIDELKILLEKKTNDLSGLWDLLQSERKDYLTRGFRKTYVKRGIAKLMTLPKKIRQQVYDQIKKGTGIKDMPKHAEKLGLASFDVSGWRVKDPEILNVLSILESTKIEEVIEEVFSERSDHWEKWLGEIRESKIEDHKDYFLENHERLCTPEGMLHHLLSHNENGQKWLFWYVIEVLKTHSGKKQGYGFSVLAQDVGYDQGISRGYKVLADWANHALKGQVPKNLLADVANALANRVSKISQKEIVKISKEIADNYLENLFEQKFATYWLFEPVPLLLVDVLNQYEINPVRIQKFTTLAGEIIGLPDRIGAPVYKIGSTIIHWKSGYDKGKGHKTKELSGRAQALRFQYRDDQFSRREGIERMILVIDGTFTQKQIDTLLEAGWDEIYYPDELEQLAQSLAPGKAIRKTIEVASATLETGVLKIES
jgi:hypothetical protein